MRVLRAGPVIGAVIFAALVAWACASTADAPTETETATPSRSTAPQTIDAYIIYRDDLGTLAVRDFKTGATYQQPVDGAKELIAQVRCTRDGSRIAYLKQVFSQPLERQIIIRGKDAPADPLRVSPLVQWVAWSPDGSKLAMVEWDGSSDPKRGTLKVMDIANGETETLLDGDQYIGNIVWSGANDRLTFYLQSADFTQADVYVMDADGSNLTRVTPGDGELIWLDPDWSPDGTWIVAAGVNEQSVQLYRVETDGSGVSLLTTSNEINKRNAYFAPDGSTIAFTGSVVLPVVSAEAAALHTVAIFTMSPDGTNERSLTADPRGTTPGPNDPYLNAYMIGWCAAGPWLDDLWTEADE
jgi:WD40 repeat protein